MNQREGTLDLMIESQLEKLREKFPSISESHSEGQIRGATVRKINQLVELQDSEDKKVDLEELLWQIKALLLLKDDVSAGSTDSSMYTSNEHLRSAFGRLGINWRQYLTPAQTQTISNTSTQETWNFVRDQKFPKDGLPFEDFAINRQQKVQEIWNLLEKETNRSILIASPPFTGKTCLLQLFAKKFAIDCVDESRVCGISFTSAVNVTEMPQLREYFNKYLRYGSKFKFKKLMDDSRDRLETCITNPDIILLADDAQHIYHMTEFWTQIKDKFSGTACKLVAFATYGLNEGLGSSTTPLGLDVYEFYNFVKFSEQDFLELALKFNQSIDPNKEILTEKVVQDIAIMTNYSPGLSFLCMRAILYDFPKKLVKQADLIRVNNQISSLYNENTVNSLISTGKLASLIYSELQARALRSITSIIEFAQNKKENAAMLKREAYRRSLNNPLIEDNIRNLFRELVYYGEIKYNEPATYEQIVLFKLGVCIKAEESIIFSCPLIQLFYQRDYTSLTVGHLCIDYTFPNDIKQFSIDVMRHFDSKVLHESLSRKSKLRHPNEVAYHHEFYRVVYLLYFKTCGGSVSANIGSIYDVPGALDLYLNDDTQYGFEFLVNSRNLDEHIDRFCQRYVNTPLKQYAVIDFYKAENENEANNLALSQDQHFNNQNYYRVVFFDSFQKFLLRHQQTSNQFRLLN